MQVPISYDLPIISDLSWHARLPVLAVASDEHIHLWIAETWSFYLIAIVYWSYIIIPVHHAYNCTTQYAHAHCVNDVMSTWHHWRSRDHWGMSIFRSKQVESMHTTKGLMITQWCIGIRVSAKYGLSPASHPASPCHHLPLSGKSTAQLRARSPGLEVLSLHREIQASSIIREVSCHFTRATFQHSIVCRQS